MDAELPCRIRGRLDDAALVPPPAHHQEVDVPELRVEAAADFDEQGVEIHVKESGRHD
jgi:hypothetical protein